MAGPAAPESASCVHGLIANLKEVAIEIAIKPWTQVADSGTAGPAIYNELLEKFRAAGIQIYMPAVRVVAA